MNVYKLVVNFHDGKKDYVSGYVYSFYDKKLFKLPEIIKPWNVSDYTIQWKNGLYTHYEMLARKELNNNEAMFIHL